MSISGIGYHHYPQNTTADRYHKNKADLPKGGNYFDRGYWQENIRKAQTSVGEDSEQEKQTENDEQKTDTEIIVKPDGSKIMMTTIRVGGTETVMSMEIAKPTNILGGDSNGTIDNPNMMISNTGDAIEAVPEK